VALVGSYLVAIRRPLPRRELDITSTINDVPDAVATGLWPIMQLGSAWGPAVVAVAVLAFLRDRLLAATIFVTGMVTWFSAKGVKQLVERGRPPAYIPDIVVREGQGTGLGYISGHSAVAAAVAVVTATALPRRARPAAAGIAALVGVARIVHGVHLPADVIGGWAFGTLTGLGGTWVMTQLRARRADASPGSTGTPAGSADR
jgi:undecaprenyl-diphosphatase